MGIVRIFGDESGIMPTQDNQDPFVAATLATIDAYPVVQWGQGGVGTIPWLVAQLQASSASPRISYVQPGPGYGTSLATRLSKLNTMGRYRLLMDGKNAAYFDPRGMRPANLIWENAVLQTVVSIAALRLIHDPIERVEIYLEEKTLKDTEHRLFEATLRRLHKNLGNFINEYQHVFPDDIATLRQHFRFSPDDITLRFVKKREPIPASDGVGLVHHLSNLGRRDLLSEGANLLHAEFSNAGFDDCWSDVTAHVAAPIDPAASQHWQAETGLPEPRE